MRKLLHLLVTRPMTTKYRTETTPRGMSSRITCRLAFSKSGSFFGRTWPRMSLTESKTRIDYRPKSGQSLQERSVQPRWFDMLTGCLRLTPLGTLLKKALMPANQNFTGLAASAFWTSTHEPPSDMRELTQGSARHSRACFHFQFLIPVLSWPVLLLRIRVLAISFSLGESQRTSEGVPSRNKHMAPTRMVALPKN